MSKRILVVDDSTSLRHVLVLSLKRSGYEVLEAENGKEALAIMEGSPLIDLVVSDLNMPEMDGLTYIRSLRKIDRYRFTPVLMLTTESSEELKMEGMEAGVRAWLTKPFQPEQLLNTISRMIQ